MRSPAVLLPALCVLLFALVTWQIVGHGPLRALDERLGRAMAGSGIPHGVAEFFADLGNTAVALPVLAAAMIVAAFRGRAPRRRLPPLAAALTMALVPALVVPVKNAIARPGPPGMPAGAHDGFFPSGHTATAAVAYGAAVLLLLHRTGPPPPSRARRVTITGCVLLNVGVGVGLVRRGYHWPLDVVGAWCLSGVLLWGLALLLTGPPRRGRRRPRASRAPASPGR
ncbi:phosphatase PAP2 family protein [Streptomyces syringium]|uniref:phosphatase PAP2 family protein n=1 Tax=Streptomyces syringium TaxID=76729 RepID=UPI003409016D